MIEWKRGNQALKWQSVRIINKVGPPSTVYGGTAGVWDTVAFASQIPVDAQPGDQLAVYICNDQSDKYLYIYDLTISVLRSDSNNYYHPQPAAATALAGRI